jgi:hypothetical protein
MGGKVSKIAPTVENHKPHVDAPQPAKVEPPTKKVSNNLHLAAKTGDLTGLLYSLLSSLDPWQLDEFDSLPVYYASLYGHVLCCSLLLIKMGGPEALTPQDRDRCTVNALNLEIKSLFGGDISCQSELNVCATI